jgi:enoyl-CoA hydratase
MRMEYRLAVHAVAGHDFREGVRAVVVDKDQSPKWNPPTLETVSDSDVSAYFAPLEQELTF